MAFNADIRNQFEFVQENQVQVASSSASAAWTHQALARQVRVRGGGCFFAPWIGALNYLAQAAG